MADVLLVRNLQVRALGVDGWERSKRQPLVIDLAAHIDVSPSGMHDLLSESVSYSAIAKEAQAFAESTSFRTLETIAAGIALVCLSKFPLERLTVSVRKPRALLHAASAGVRISRAPADIPALVQAVASQTADSPPGPLAPILAEHVAKAAAAAASSTTATTPATTTPAGANDTIEINDLQLSCVIGVHPWEREERQRVIINLVLHVHMDAHTLVSDHLPKMHNYRTITRLVSRLVEDSSYKTVEALVLNIARLLTQVCFVPKVTVRAEKPSALIFAAAAGVEITRTRESLMEALSPASASAHHGGRAAAGAERPATVLLAVGTNLGDRMNNIDQALSRLTASGITIVDTSFLYETSPMYVTDQPLFLNACIKVETTLEPHALLKQLKVIEADLGRDLVGGQRYGPRPIDLDILYYDELELKTETLVIPHPRISEREFVLRPLCDIVPNMEHPGLFRTVRQLLALLKHEVTSDRMWKVVPIRGRVWRLEQRTHIMGILNVTPDSFSDGGQFTALESAVERGLQMVAEGADVIDIGGQSTRPNAAEVTEDEEIQRVVPVIRALRARDANVCISIDTYRARVAQEALAAGADLINDVSGGTRDPRMLAVMASAHVPVCLMHMRGDSHTMMSLTDYGGDVVGSVRAALATLVAAALSAGVYRWHLILDPGIGFAKTLEQNYEILRRMREMFAAGTALSGFPALVGPSRKGFIGQTIQEADPEKRAWGTAAACSASVAGGAGILRVHDIKPMKDVVLVADQCFRS